LSEVNCEQSRNWLESGKMAIGSGTKRALKSVQDSKCKEILLAVRSCLKTTTVYVTFRNTCPLVMLFFVTCSVCIHWRGNSQKVRWQLHLSWNCP